tara:strand:- start:218 stop:394 length:177 start_codon:yes stop_codon:yes gene_type:complete
MKKEEIYKKLENNLVDLWTKDLLALVEAKRFEEAISAGNYLGIPKKEIKKIIQEYKRG